MAEAGVPACLTKVIAAAIVGVARPTFRKRFLPLLRTRRRGRRDLIETVSLEAAMGRRIKASEYLLAEASREPARQYQRQYRATRQRGTDNAAA
jgi:hypothetical protein